MSNLNIFTVFNTQSVCYLAVLKLYRYGYRTFLGFDLLRLGLIRIKTDIIKENVISRNLRLSFFKVGIKCRKISLSLFFGKWSHCKVSIIGNGIGLLKDCCYRYLTVLEFINPLGINVVNRNYGNTVLYIIYRCCSAYLLIVLVRHDISYKALL